VGADEYEAWAITITGRGSNATAGLTAGELAHPQQAPDTVPAVGVVASENSVVRCPAQTGGRTGEENAPKVRRMSWLSGALGALMVLQTLAWLAALAAD
jgi:hypothetical protein